MNSPSGIFLQAQHSASQQMTIPKQAFTFKNKTML